MSESFPEQTAGVDTLQERLAGPDHRPRPVDEMLSESGLPVDENTRRAAREYAQAWNAVEDRQQLDELRDPAAARGTEDVLFTESLEGTAQNFRNLRENVTGNEFWNSDEYRTLRQLRRERAEATDPAEIAQINDEIDQQNKVLYSGRLGLRTAPHLDDDRWTAGPGTSSQAVLDAERETARQDYMEASDRRRQAYPDFEREVARMDRMTGDLRTWFQLHAANRGYDQTQRRRAAERINQLAGTEIIPIPNGENGGNGGNGENGGPEAPGADGHQDLPYALDLTGLDPLPGDVIRGDMYYNARRIDNDNTNRVNPLHRNDRALNQSDVRELVLAGEMTSEQESVKARRVGSHDIPLERLELKSDDVFVFKDDTVRDNAIQKYRRYRDTSLSRQERFGSRLGLGESFALANLPAEQSGLTEQERQIAGVWRHYLLDRINARVIWSNLQAGKERQAEFNWLPDVWALNQSYLNYQHDRVLDLAGRPANDPERRLEGDQKLVLRHVGIIVDDSPVPNDPNPERTRQRDNIVARIGRIATGRNRLAGNEVRRMQREQAEARRQAALNS